MKTLEEIVNKRNMLQFQLEHYLSEKNRFTTSGKLIWSELPQEERAELGRILRIVGFLQIQIDALTYVVNFDSPLRDVTKPNELKTNN